MKVFFSINLSEKLIYQFIQKFDKAIKEKWKRTNIPYMYNFIDKKKLKIIIKLVKVSCVVWF